MVPEIEEIRAELEFMALFDAEVLLHREVPILLERATERIPRHGAESRRARRPVSNQGSRREAGRVQVVGQDVGPRARRVHASQSAAVTREGSRAATGLSKCSAAGAVCDRKRQPALVGDNPADRPTCEWLMAQETARGPRQIVGIADH